MCKSSKGRSIKPSTSGRSQRKEVFESVTVKITRQEGGGLKPGRLHLREKGKSKKLDELFPKKKEKVQKKGFQASESKRRRSNLWVPTRMIAIKKKGKRWSKKRGRSGWGTSRKGPRVESQRGPQMSRKLSSWVFSKRGGFGRSWLTKGRSLS